MGNKTRKKAHNETCGSLNKRNATFEVKREIGTSPTHKMSLFLLICHKSIENIQFYREHQLNKLRFILLKNKQKINRLSKKLIFFVYYSCNLCVSAQSGFQQSLCLHSFDILLLFGQIYILTLCVWFFLFDLLLFHRVFLFVLFSSAI